MQKNLLLIIITIVLTAGALFVLYYFNKPTIDTNAIILFYGEGCPHCKTVDDFINQNKIGDKVEFTRLEVWYNKNNQNILAEIAQKCGIKTNQVGVPFLWDGDKCYIGDEDTINFFKQQAGIN